MKPLALLCSILFLYNSTAYSQILIGGLEGNTIYSGIDSRIQYVGSEECQELSVRLEGQPAVTQFENCAFTIPYLLRDSAQLEIFNPANELVYSIMLFKDSNRPSAYLHVGNQLYLEGAIPTGGLSLLKGIKVKYACPWMEEPTVVGFNIIVVNDQDEVVACKLSGSQISDSCLSRIQRLANPRKIYVENIRHRGLHCFDRLYSIVLDIN